MQAYKCLRSLGRSLCGDFSFPVTGLPWTVEHHGPAVLCHSGFHASPSPALAAKHAVAGANLMARVKMEGIAEATYDKAVARRMTLLSVEEDFVHPSQLAPTDCAELALHVARQVASLYDHPTPRDAIKAAERFLGHPSEEHAWNAREAGIASMDAAKKATTLAHSGAAFSCWAAAWAAANIPMGWDTVWAASASTYWAALSAASAALSENDSRLAEEGVWTSCLCKGRELMTKRLMLRNEETSSGANGWADVRAGHEKRPCRVVIGAVRPNTQEAGVIFVSATLRRAGFEVVNLGVNVPAERFFKVALRRAAPLVAMGVYTDDGLECVRDVLKMLKGSGTSQKTIVGGQGISRSEAATLGADAYVENGLEAADVALHLGE